MSRALRNENGGQPVNGDARSLIAASGLPLQSQLLIAQVVKRTRLWKREKAAITAELIAHFHDGLEAGNSVEELIAAFGNPRTTAQLMRRSKKRNRPLWWRGARRILQGVGIILVLYVGQMVILLTGHPKPKIDYAARLCEKSETIAQADRAWPIYRQAWLLDPPLHIDWKPGPVRSNRSLIDSHPGDPKWNQAIALVQQHRPLVEAARAGGMKPGLGITIRQRRGFEETQYRAIFPLRSSGPVVSPWQMGEMDCPETGAIVEMVKLLMIDLRWAATQNDPARVVQDYRAITGMFRQIREVPTLIGQLLVVIYLARTDQALAEVIVQNPDLLSQKQYIELLHTIPSARDAINVSAESSRAEMDDLIQRMYTDDDCGDGRLTREGVEYFFRSEWTRDQPPKPSVASALTLPLLSAGIASRREMTQVVREQYDLLDRTFNRTLRQSLTPVPDEVTQHVQTMRGSLLTSLHYWPLSVNIPQFTGAGKDLHIARATHDAVIVGLALESYRLANGGYPQALDALVPHYLAAVPLDPLANQPLLYTLRDGHPVIYARGREGVDHGGVRPKTTAGYGDIPETGDWVLYPPVEEAAKQ